MVLDIKLTYFLRLKKESGWRVSPWTEESLLQACLHLVRDKWRILGLFSVISFNVPTIVWVVLFLVFFFWSRKKNKSLMLFTKAIYLLLSIVNVHYLYRYLISDSTCPCFLPVVVYQENALIPRVCYMARPHLQTIKLVELEPL